MLVKSTPSLLQKWSKVMQNKHLAFYIKVTYSESLNQSAQSTSNAWPCHQGRDEKGLKGKMKEYGCEKHALST